MKIVVPDSLASPCKLSGKGHPPLTGGFSLKTGLFGAPKPPDPYRAISTGPGIEYAKAHIKVLEIVKNKALI